MLDMFSGSGAMGLEAVSRGADAADLVEMNRRGAEQIRRTVEKLRAENEVKVYAEDVFAFLSRTSTCYDLVFIDPPFAAGLQKKAIELVRGRLNAAALLYVESPEEMTDEVLAEVGVAAVRRGRAGGVYYLLAKKKETP